MKSALMTVYAGTAIVSAILFLAGPGLAYLRIIPPMAGFGMFGLGGLLGVLVTIAGIIAILRGNTGAVVAFWFLGAVPAGFLVYGVVAGRNYPRINDISTELVNPPKFRHAAQLPENEGWDMSFPALNAELIQEHYPHVKALPLSGTIDDVFGRAQQLASGQAGWTMLGADNDEKRRTIEGYSESGLFKFRDYFVIEIREIEGGGVVVNMRSKSKDGLGDFGVNATRIAEFFERLKA